MKHRMSPVIVGELEFNILVKVEHSEDLIGSFKPFLKFFGTGLLEVPPIGGVE